VFSPTAKWAMGFSFLDSFLSTASFSYYICRMTLLERDKAVIWHPFTPFKHSPEPIPIVKGDAVYLIDEAGNQYIDAISSWWVTLHGHAHPYIAEKIYQQALTLEQVIFAGFTHQPAIELAERLLPKLPGPFSKIFYSDNGSTATEVAVKMALQYWWNKEAVSDELRAASQKKPRRKMLAFNNSYHGDTFGAMSVSDRSIFTLAFHDKLFEVIFIDTPTQENIQAVKETINKEADEIAAFIYEPLLQGAGGMKMYEATLLDEILHTVKKQGIICIADEVMTGFGRTGKLFASDYCKEKPDIICLSKGLTGGTMALGVTAVTQPVVEAFISDDKLKTFFHGHSFTANPLACTAALASLDLLEKESCAENIQSIVKHHTVFTRQLKSNHHTLVKNIRQLGTIIAFEIEQGTDGYLNNIATVITQKALKKGLYIRPLGNTVYLMPPYCITATQLQQTYSAITEIIAEIQTPSSL
jgi:adenosylmethionine---8-amino-7-oxononanoate aminotransferase